MKYKRGFFAIGIYHAKTEVNVGTLWRSASLFGAAYIFTIGKRYKKQSSDTMKSWKHIPLFHYETFEEFYNALPHDCRLAGIELTESAKDLKDYTHPERCVYLLGAEDHGLNELCLQKCHNLVKLPGEFSMNVAVAGSIVMYDRISKLF